MLKYVFQGTRRYTLPNRLSDVIRLISVLSQDTTTFRTEKGIQNALRGKPLSLGTWQQIVDAHPEFFRPNGDNSHFALVIRSYFPEEEGKGREPFSVGETQKLIDTAIDLHEKEIQRRQMNSHLFPIIVAIIAVAGAIFSAVYPSHENNTMNNKIDSLSRTLQRIEFIMDTKAR